MTAVIDEQSVQRKQSASRTTIPTTQQIFASSIEMAKTKLRADVNGRGHAGAATGRVGTSPAFWTMEGPATNHISVHVALNTVYLPAALVGTYGSSGWLVLVRPTSNYYRPRCAHSLQTVQTANVYVAIIKCGADLPADPFQLEGLGKVTRDHADKRR